MKKLSTFFILSFIGFHAIAQFSASANYSLGLPQQRMAKNINAIHQLVLTGGYRLPHSFNFMTLGTEIGFGGYANLRVPTTFSFGNGNPTSTHINYSSNTFNANAFVTFDLIRKFPITPYAILKGGLQNFNSTIRIEDPNDLDGCQPLESESILNDNTRAFSYGGGLRYELSRRATWGRGRVNKHFINVQVLQTRGGTLDYINTKKLKHPAQHNPTTVQEPDNDGTPRRPLEMKFINVQSQTVHNHMIAEVFSTPLRVLDIRVGYFVEF